jgi:hypothetical protein
LPPGLSHPTPVNPGFRDYSLLYLSGLVSLIAVLILFIGVESGLVIVSANLPTVSAVVRYVFDYDSGWIFYSPDVLSFCLLHDGRIKISP